MHGNPHDNDERRHDSRPFLAIPYWEPTLTDPVGDTGEIRPVPSNVVPYLCPGIHASAYAPGANLTVRVDVRNSGGANTSSLAQVTVWWTDPTTGFIIDPDRLIGFDLVAVGPRGDQATSKPMTKRIPANAPPHVCLLARVSHQFDLANATPTPAAERHWAQRNIAVVPAPAIGTPINFKFLAGNPLLDAADFTLFVQPMGRESLAHVAREVRADPTTIDARLNLNDTRDHLDREDSARHVLSLRPGEQRPMHLRILLGESPARGQFVGFEITQRLGPRGRIVGSLAVVAQA